MFRVWAFGIMFMAYKHHIGLHRVSPKNCFLPAQSLGFGRGLNLKLPQSPNPLEGLLLFKNGCLHPNLHANLALNPKESAPSIRKTALGYPGGGTLPRHTFRHTVGTLSPENIRAIPA